MENEEAKKERIRSLKQKLDAPRMVGEGDIVPFAWRQPLGRTGQRMNRYYKTLTSGERERNLPAISDKEP